ncbi:NAD(P)/FAD-dependent oxidoreductase [Robertkochia aurantiaca]|uniref:NAD(P)/FAD-dependent oxidoreductase n=1 Tax=Robertkochia aurantiaca TaxID=2873700 RepID=UPI001CCAAD6E|nr:FAD-dependent oxidoreductase [Robertkochia sp. 3YJGBD-33]
MQKKIVIIGGGIVGLSTAYFLNREGHQVTVIDKGEINQGASFVNAGYITPSHIISLAAPGMITKGLKWMFNSSSPFYMKPRLDPEFIKWSWAFYKSSTPHKVERSIPVIKDFNLLSKEIYDQWHSSGELGDFQWERKGLLMLYQSDEVGDKEKQVAERAAHEGLEVRLLDKEQTQALEPDTEMNVKGAIHYECDAHTTPGEIMGKLASYLEEKGVNLVKNETVTGMERSGKNITAVSTANNLRFEADEFVLASGAWTQELASLTGVKLLVQAGKGYRINEPGIDSIHYPAVLMESKVALTPMKGFTRLAGTMEFSGINHYIRKERVKAIADAIKRYYPELQISQEAMNKAECGLRPVTPDGLPYVGRPGKINNLVVAAGHAMMGWSLGPATGKLVSEIIDNKETPLFMEALHPERSFY